MKKRVLIFSTLFLLAGLIGFFAGPGLTFFKRMPLNPLRAAYLYWNTKVHASTEIPSYTIYMTERGTDPKGYVRDGVRLVLKNTPTTLMIIARRSDGSTAEYISHTDSMKLWPTDRVWEEGAIIDLTARQFIETARLVNAKTTYPLKASAVPLYQTVSASPASDCLLSATGAPAWGYQSLKIVGHEQILGYDTVHLVADGGADQKTGQHHTLEKWLAPGLGCAAVKRIATKTDSDNKLLYESAQEPDRIDLGEPPADLFTAATLDELKPSDSLARRQLYWAHFIDQPDCPNCSSSAVEREKAAIRDKQYAASQANH